jgi:hypothetical protein
LGGKKGHGAKGSEPDVTLSNQVPQPGNMAIHISYFRVALKFVKTTTFGYAVDGIRHGLSSISLLQIVVV